MKDLIETFTGYSLKDITKAGIHSLSEKAMTNITDEIFQGIGNFFTMIVNAIGELLDHAIGAVFVSSTEFKGLTGQISKSTSGIDPFETMLRMSVIIGMSLLVLFLVFYIVKYFLFNNEMRQTPLNIFIKAAICAFLILNSKTMINELIFPAYNNFGNAVISYGVIDKKDTVMGESGGGYLKNHENDMSWLPGNIDELGSAAVGGGAVALTVLGASVASFTAQPLIYFIPLIMFLIAFPIIKSIITMLLEIAERYIVTMFLLLFAPIFLATAILQDTENVWKSYVRMVISSSILITIYTVVFKVGLMGIQASWTYESILNYALTLAFWKMAKRLDVYFNSMGLNMAQTGGQLMDAAGVAAKGLMQDITRGNEVRNAAGKGLQTVGSAIGGKTGETMFKMGNVVASSMMNPVVSTNQMNTAFTNAVARTGGKAAEFSGKESAHMLGRFIHNPRGYTDNVSAMSTKSIADGLSHMSGGRISGIDESSISVGSDGSLSFRGLDNETGEMRDYDLSGKADGLGMVVGDGNNSGFLNTLPDRNLQAGDTVQGNADDVAKQIGALGLTDPGRRADLTDMSDADYKSITGAVRNKDGSWALKSGDRTIGQVGNGKIVQRSQIPDYANTSQKQRAVLDNSLNSSRMRVTGDGMIQQAGNGAKFVVGEVSSNGSSSAIQKSATFIPTSMDNRAGQVAEAAQEHGIAKEYKDDKGRWTSDASMAYEYDDGYGNSHLVGRISGSDDDGFNIPITETMPGADTSELAKPIMSNMGYDLLDANGMKTDNPNDAYLYHDDKGAYFKGVKADSDTQDQIYVSDGLDRLDPGLSSGSSRTFTHKSNNGRHWTKERCTVINSMAPTQTKDPTEDLPNGIPDADRRKPRG